MASNRLEAPVGEARMTQHKSCDSCRRRKVRCLRGSPCLQCATSFHDCTYSTPSRRKSRKKTLSLEAVDDLRSRDTDAAKPWTLLTPASDPHPSPPQHEITPAHGPTEPSMGKPEPTQIGKCPPALHTVEQGEMEFQGYSADRTFIRGLQEKLGDWPVDVFSRFSRIGPLQPSLAGLSQMYSQKCDDLHLPARGEAVALVQAALDAQILFCVVHRPTFESSFNLVYSLEPSEYSSKEKRFLSLLYATLAYGSLFVEPEAQETGYEQVILKASRYYIKSKQLQDVSSCRDLVSLQAIVFMNLFLLAINRPSTCYTYLSTSLSIALRMGLHRSLGAPEDFICCETGKRVFWALRLLSGEVAACAGLPRLLNDEEIDQELPREVNDAYVQRARILPQPESEICYVSGANAYKRLHMILDKVIRRIYPQSGRNGPGNRGSVSYAVRLDTIREIEKDLHEWSEAIPRGYRLSSCYEEPALQRAQYVLCITFAHIQLCLYRPFLHCILENADPPNLSARGSSSCAAACIQASQTIVALCEDMFKRGFLGGMDWPVPRLLTSCLMTLLYVIIVSRKPREADSLCESFATGRRILTRLAKRSFTSQRSKIFIAILISTLPKSFDGVREKLLDLDSKAQDAGQPGPFEDDHCSVHGSYTVSLAKQCFSLSTDPTLRESGTQSATGYESLKYADSIRSVQPDQKLPLEPTQLQPSPLPSSQLFSSNSATPDVLAPAAGRNSPEAPSRAAQDGSPAFHNLNSSGVEVSTSTEEALMARPFSFYPTSPGAAFPQGFGMGDFMDSETYDEPMLGVLGALDEYDAEDMSDLRSWL